MAGLLLFFGPAQVLLTNPDLQSPKFLAAFTAEPAPLASEAPSLLVAGVLAIGALWGLVYSALSGGWGGAWWRRGLRFAAVSWALMVPWFEFYLPWNVMREPVLLVVLDMICWAGVLLGVGVTIAGVDAALQRRAHRP